MREFPLIETSSCPAAIDVAEVAGIADAVDVAAAAAAPEHAFLRAAWYRACVGGDAATLLATRPDGRVIAALPTVTATGLPLGLRAVPGSYWPYRSFPVAADAGDEELVAFLAHPLARRRLGPLWRVGPMREDDPTGRRLAAVATRAGWTSLARRTGTSFLLDLAALRSESAWPRSSTLKKNRYFEKHLAADGALDFRFFRGSDWTPALFDELAGIEANSWVASDTDGRDAKFLAPRHRVAWEAVAADPALAAMMSAAVLRIGGRPAAFAFDLECGATRYCIANSYDARFARHSPGRVLAYRSFERLEELGIGLLDWGAGDPGYKQTIGATAGPAIVDLLFARSAAAAALIRPLWRA